MIRFFISWVKAFLVAAAVGVGILFVVAVILWYMAPDIVLFYSLSIVIPAVLAVIVVVGVLYRSGYAQVAGELGVKRTRPPYNRAGLCYIRSNTNSVLLNLQTQPPWRGLWLLPGGYFNPEKEDKVTSDTARRRFKELVTSDLDIVPRVRIAQTNFNPQYVHAIIEYGHVPTHDDVYLVLKRDDTSLDESDIKIMGNRLQWVTASEIAAGLIDVPPHIEDLLLFLLDQGADTRRLKYWTLERDYEEFMLQSPM